MTTKATKCVHRHTIKTHPNCFKVGRVIEVKTEAIARKIRTEKTVVGMPKRRVNVQKKEPWYQHESTRIGYFDIEFNNLVANYGNMLSWAIKERGNPNVAVDAITQEEILAGEPDLRIVKSCLAEIKKYNIIITYYGTRHDIKYVRSRAEFWYQKVRLQRIAEYKKLTVAKLRKLYKEITGETIVRSAKKNDIIQSLIFVDAELESLEFPRHGEISHFDLYYSVRKSFRLHRNSLDAVTRFLGIEGKNHLSSEEWMFARIGEPKAVEIMIAHNIEDVKILEELHDVLAPYRRWIRNSL